MYGARLEVLDIRVGTDPDIDHSLAEMKTSANYLAAGRRPAVCAVLFVIVARMWRRNAATPAKCRNICLQPARAPSLAVAVAMIGSAFFARLSVPMSQPLGSVAIFLVFACVLVVILSLLQTWSDRQGIPWLLVLVIWFLACPSPT